MNNLLKNIKVLVNLIKEIHDELLIKSVKDPSLKDLLRKAAKIKEATSLVLDDLQFLPETDPNVFMCYENNIYLYVENKRYVIAYGKNGKAEVLSMEKKLKKAIEKFYQYAYKENLK